MKQSVVGTKFRIFFLQANWFRASHHCIHKKMRLASVFSQSEFNQLIRQIRESGKFIRFKLGVRFANGTLLGYTDGFWISLTRLGSLNFYWFGYDKPVTSWQKKQVGETAETPQHCIVINPNENYVGYWPTEDCDRQLHFVCESDD